MVTSPDPSGYTGSVSPGGDADVRELDALRITKVAVDPQMSNNCYLLRCTATGDQLLVDAADEATRLLDLVGDAGLTRVVTTHQHWDHHRALAEVVQATGAEVLVGEPDAEETAKQTGVTVDRHLRDGDEVTVGEVTLRVIHLVGHTPGSVALVYDDTTPGGHPHLFTGDSLFPGGPGKTWSAEDNASLLDDLEAKVFGTLPDSTWFYPGHGDDSTLGAERPHLAEWRERGW
ncbi:MBL fold metallo-hydrolase [Nocardioides sp. CFH 31398]|uniref:MBL fold metallo-hydrolase n=1 Tax=Nocardioides sp. CFH 31398 TaxID=2919579 RepID=UPI001F056310|nr:MBL fold metallo-hydrolase [Nocardioides sp. CFH 31398]MCH1866725.1 MBL fold metallo-hydrolase [Nocardioides sp. CFH 31398]